VDHCLRSNAGLFYADRDEFVEALKLLLSDHELREAMGQNGREYIRRNYRWDVVLNKFERILGKIRK
jgi:glycosyltransferase involved in cell wall biosynthesis